MDFGVVKHYQLLLIILSVWKPDVVGAYYACTRHVLLTMLNTTTGNSLNLFGDFIITHFTIINIVESSSTGMNQTSEKDFKVHCNNSVTLDTETNVIENEEQLVAVRVPLVCSSLNFSGFGVRSIIRIKIFGCSLGDHASSSSSIISCNAACATSTTNPPQCSATTIIIRPTSTVLADGTNLVSSSTGPFASSRTLDTSCSAERTTAIVIPVVMLLMIIVIIAVIVAVVYLLMSKGNKSGIDDDEPVTLREITTTALYAESSLNALTQVKSNQLRDTEFDYCQHNHFPPTNTPTDKAHKHTCSNHVEDELEYDYATTDSIIIKSISSNQIMDS